MKLFKGIIYGLAGYELYSRYEEGKDRYGHFLVVTNVQAWNGKYVAFHYIGDTQKTDVAKKIEDLIRHFEQNPNPNYRVKAYGIASRFTQLEKAFISDPNVHPERLHVFRNLKDFYKATEQDKEESIKESFLATLR